MISRGAMPRRTGCDGRRLGMGVLQEADGGVEISPPAVYSQRYYLIFQDEFNEVIHRGR